MGVFASSVPRKPSLAEVVEGLVKGTIGVGNACKCDMCLNALLIARDRLRQAGSTMQAEAITAKLEELWPESFPK